MTEIDTRIANRLADLGIFADEAAWVVRYGREAYVADSPDGALLRNAGERILIKVATVVEKLPIAFKDQYPAIEWVAISRLRNLVAHHYDKINDDLIWASLEQDIPHLAWDLGLRHEPTGE